MSAYKIYGYRTHEDSQYGRKEKLGETEGYVEAVKKANSLREHYRDYQTMVYSGNEMMYACRKDEEFCFLNEKLRVAFRGFVVDLYSSIQACGFKGFRYILEEKNGKVSILDGMSYKVLVDDVFSRERDGIVHDTTRLIEFLNSNIPNPVKRVAFVLREGARGYFTKSLDEEGSIDLYYDYF